MSSFQHTQNRAVVPFADATVGDAMHSGVLTCPPETPLPIVARMMASYGVHAIVVTDLDPEGDPDARPWGVVSGLDLVRAAGMAADATAGGVATTELITVDPNEPLARAAQLMAEHELTHLVAVDSDGRPLGIVSTHDVAGALTS